MHKIFRLLVVIFIPVCVQAQGAPKLQKHSYHVGEKHSFFFENTETSYATSPGSPQVKPEALLTMEEIRAKVTVEIISVKGGLTKKVTLRDVTYRTQTGEEIAAGKTVLYLTVKDLIPGFPPDFSYTYHIEKNDGEVEAQLNGFFKDFAGSNIGTFLYYKMQDFHAFQASADGVIQKALAPGRSTVSKKVDIPLADGVFHNAPVLANYNRETKIDGAPAAYFKSMVMGNSYEMKGPATIDTNYQYSFYVPLAGKDAGLATRGEMTETIYTGDKTTKETHVIQRMVSLSPL